MRKAGEKSVERKTAEDGVNAKLMEFLRKCKGGKGKKKQSEENDSKAVRVIDEKERKTTFPDARLVMLTTR